MHRHFRPWIAFVFAAALSAAAAGCGDDSVTNPTGMSQTDADEIAQQLALQLAIDNGGEMNTLNGGTTLLGARNVRREPSDPGQPVAGQWDTSFTRGGISYALSYMFYDLAGNLQTRFDPLTTYRLEESVTAAGTLVLPAHTASFRHVSDLEATGLGAPWDTVTFSGTTQDTALTAFKALYTDRQRWFWMSSQGTLAGLKALKDTTVTKYPVGGTLRWTVQAVRLRSNNRADVEAQLDATVVVTFNGTRFPDVLVNGQWRYVFDLRNGTMVRAGWDPA